MFGIAGVVVVLVGMLGIGLAALAPIKGLLFLLLLTRLKLRLRTSMLAALGLDGPETIAIVLVERSGRIVWQQSGRFDQGKLERLRATLG